MSATWGEKFKVTVFGESHGAAIGAVIEGLPAGFRPDFAAVDAMMARRSAKGKEKMATARAEGDEYEVLSGLFNGCATGTPLCVIIRNKDTHSPDYERMRYLMRPGHSDWGYYVKEGGFNDYRGGGHSSGRLTAPLVFAGAVAKQILKQHGVTVGAHIASIYGIEDTPFDAVGETPEHLSSIAAKPFPTISDEAGERMRRAIFDAREQLDSVGGSIECCVLGMPAGLGSPDFGCNVEGIVSQYLFAVPAVKAVAFGAGFGFASMRGSEANDPMTVENGVVRTTTNHTGGVNGGITNGMPIVFTAAMRPTPSISQPQQTVSLSTMENATLTVRGRHDPCIVHRAVPVLEAACALAMCEILKV